MADKNESSYVQRVLKRTREMARIPAGKASETPGNQEKRKRSEFEDDNIGGNPQASTSGPAITVGNSQGALQTEAAHEIQNQALSAQGEILNCGKRSPKWRQINKTSRNSRPI